MITSEEMRKIHRAVDADAVANQLVERKMISRKRDSSPESDIGNFDMLMGIPVFDPFPNAYWILRDDGGIYCSNCESDLPFVIHLKFGMSGTYTTRTNIDRTRFCPNCGAYMNEEGEIKDYD